jgi:iron-sulfur cluster assembly protein
MITLTPTAEKRIKSMINSRQKGVGIRLGVKTTGCSGLGYTLEYVDNPQAADIEYNYNDFKVLVDPKSEVYLKGMTLDYVRNGLNEGFEFINPNAKDYCGCGESFRV